jgi:aspartate/methionine/tyrosine aminotransferase
VFEPHKHISLRALPGMQERCIRLGSAGKTFSFTAWKVGAAWSQLATLKVIGIGIVLVIAIVRFVCVMLSLQQ